MLLWTPTAIVVRLPDVPDEVPAVSVNARPEVTVDELVTELRALADALGPLRATDSGISDPA